MIRTLCNCLSNNNNKFINGTRSYGNNRNFQKNKTDTEDIIRKIKILQKKKFITITINEELPCSTNHIEGDSLKSDDKSYN